MSNVHAPEYVGRGVWWTIHTACAAADTDEKKTFALNLINMIKVKFSCKICREHFKAFIDVEPPEEYASEEEGLFLWSYHAHRNANTITGAPQISYKEARDLYFGDSAFCTKGCGVPNEEKIERIEKEEKTKGSKRRRYVIRG